MSEFKIDFFELCFLAETCIPPTPIARAYFWKKLIDEYYHQLSNNQRETMFIAITRHHKFDIDNEDCKLFYNRYYSLNQYKVTTNFNDKIEINDCFLHNGKFHKEINRYIQDKYIIEVKNK
jgi:hypothetical protein